MQTDQSDHTNALLTTPWWADAPLGWEGSQQAAPPHGSLGYQIAFYCRCTAVSITSDNNGTFSLLERLETIKTVSIWMKQWRDQSYKVPAGGVICMVALYPNVSQVCHLRPKEVTYKFGEQVVVVVVVRDYFNPISTWIYPMEALWCHTGWIDLIDLGCERRKRGYREKIR